MDIEFDAPASYEPHSDSGYERMFTETRVKAMLLAILRSGIPHRPGSKYTFHGSGVIRSIAKKNGIDLGDE